MKVFLCLCFIIFLTAGVTGNPCAGKADFEPCGDNNLDCDEKISKCTCFTEEPFCRCNNNKNEFYIGDDCSQRWTVVTFALVASLPGLTLAVLVGVIVYMLMVQSNNSHTSEQMKAASKEQDLFPGIAFASDMNGRPPPNMRPAQQDHVPLKAMPIHPYSMSRDPPMTSPAQPYSISNGMRDQSMGAPARPYSASNTGHPSADNVTDGRPRQLNSGMRDPPMGGPVQPYSDGAGRGQIVSNPYVRDLANRNPYEDLGSSADRQSDYRSTAPSYTYDNQIPNPPYSPAPLFGSSEQGNIRTGFPRPQLSLKY
ncbi:uncharacterized protein LOC555281 precursor [Danio rerio]|uniref:Uncharacterized protein LOC555281 precursor n=1 Tax=Danio rerio TaxID=7955 RepID=A0PJS9_DANRE|nr:uncharacterized protein LOC555281 precursor [Danio rerio]AAI27598.1 Zgc:158432 [Danio rerio]|eukprot:NP_001073426.1 uncharacterized protein LOC555281 precursor [Danio rerio]